jgi:glutamine synthetase
MNTPESILKMAKDLKVRFIRLQFSDVLGMVKNVAIPVSQLHKALNNEIMFDGSSIQGFTRIEESDMNLRPDLDSFAIYPLSDNSDEQRVARLICDVYKPNGEPFEGDPRYRLKLALKKAEEMGLSIYIGPELEFFLFKRSPDGLPMLKTHDTAGYFDLGPLDLGEDARREIVIALEAMGFEIEASHHEVAAGQHEIDFRYGPALTAADQVNTVKIVTRAVAAKHGLHATFMPKPIYGICGSGMHTHISAFKGEANLFYDPHKPYQLSEIALHFIGGLLKHAPALTAICNPLVNSYKRLVPGFEAPVYISWSAQNRSALIRVPSSRGTGTRLELRSPDPSCNPYLAFAVMIEAGLDGVINKIVPSDSTTCNIYDLTDEERSSNGLKTLPANLLGALEELSKDAVIKQALGDHIYNSFVQAKNIEWHSYTTRVSDWEIEQYLGVY